MNRNFEHTLHNDYDSLRQLCAAAADFLEAHAIPPDITYAVDLTLEELVTNVIKYGYDDDARHEIKASISIEPGHLVVLVEDDGHEFDPTLVPTPDIEKPLEERKVGGLGIHLVRNVSESISYRREANKNIVTARIKR